MVIAPLLALVLAADTGESPRPEDRIVDPAAAVELLLAPAARRPEQAGEPWNGSLGDLTLRGLFGFYRVVLSSQDLQVCGFSPSCSRFSRRAIARFGLLHGVLLTADRLLRDHPLARGAYDLDAGTGRLRDDVDRYGSGERP